MEQETQQEKSNKLSIPMAIILVGVFIAGAILLSGNKSTQLVKTSNEENKIELDTLSPITESDKTLGSQDAKITLVVYEDFQCPYCGAVTGLDPNSPALTYLKQIDPNWTPFMPEIINSYVKNGDVLLVYRDYAFLGKESIRSAEAARCAGDQDKFWEYHDYLYSHQNGENQGGFSDSNLKLFASNISLDTTLFNQCLDQNKYEKYIIDSKNEGDKAGVTGTPKGFILENGKIVDTIDGAESLSTVKQKIDAILK